MVKSKQSRQVQYFQRLLQREQLPSSKPLVGELTKLWGVSASSVYGRLNGSTPLNYDQYALVSQHYGFYYRDLVDQTRSIPQLGTLNGLHQIAHELEETYAAGEALRYSTSEVPIFYLFSEPDLVHLKRHIWTHRGRGNQRTDLPLLHLPPPTERLEARDPAHVELLGLRDSYQRIQRQELWSEGMFDNVIGQLHHLRRVQSIDAATYERLAAAVLRVVDGLQEVVRDALERHHLGIHFDVHNNAAGSVLRVGKQPIVYLTATDLTINRIASDELYQLYEKKWVGRLFYAIDLSTCGTAERRRCLGLIRQRVEWLLTRG